MDLLAIILTIIEAVFVIAASAVAIFEGVRSLWIQKMMALKK